LFSYDRSAIAEAPPRVGRAKQSVAFRRTGVVLEESIIHCKGLWSAPADSIETNPTFDISFFILHQINCAQERT
jgi:hypothetical protein